MKIIDLLNKIANGEEVPKKIKFRGVIYDYYKDEDFINYKPDYGDWLLNQYLWKLNDEVEIIEEEKEIKHIDIKYWSDDEYTPEERINVCMTIINRIIDEINKLKRDKE